MEGVEKSENVDNVEGVEGQKEEEMAVVKEEEEPEVEEQVQVPSRKVGAIIGRGGDQIVSMERLSGAKIQVGGFCIFGQP